jgi:hypothetical protein
MTNPIEYGISETFGMAKENTGRSIPGFFRLDWTVDDDEFPDYDCGYPPLDGTLELSYYTCSIEEWTDILHRYEQRQIDWPKAREKTRIVNLQTFPEAFDLFDRLLQEFVDGKIAKENLVRTMLEASQRRRTQ